MTDKKTINLDQAIERACVRAVILPTMMIVLNYFFKVGFHAFDAILTIFLSFIAFDMQNILKAVKLDKNGEK